MCEEIVWTKEYKVERYRKMNKDIKKGSVIFAGSSLMEMFPIEQFAADDKLPVTVYNRGIGGFITDELIKVMDVCILDLEPAKLFINIGTNDLSDSRIEMSTVMKNYEYILRETIKRVPDVKIYLMAYYPVNPEAATEETKGCLRVRTNEKIDIANEEVKKLAHKLDAKYIDVNAPLKDEKGRLKKNTPTKAYTLKRRATKPFIPL